MTGMVDEPGSTPGATVPSNISRLNPQDGLFLRGEHLAAMQGYARDLARAVGTGVGSGVVYGYTATLTANKLRVGAGLALDPQGRPLRSDAEAVIELKDPPVLDSSGNGFLVVEVGPAEWASGHEKVYGEVCGDGCSGSGSSIQPWIGEGITVHLMERSIEGLNTAGKALRRNRLASLFFEAERRNGDTWLQPEPGQPTLPVTSWDWNAGTPAAQAARVPIAALLAVDGKWVLDVWTARRDVDGPPAKNIWQSRLSMRPWTIFMAQVLQFQAQLAAHAPELEKYDFDVEAFNAVGQLNETIRKLPLTKTQHTKFGQVLEEAMEKAEKVVRPRAESRSSLLRAMGFDNLPPAGYLPLPRAAGSVEAAVRLLLGSRLDCRFVSASADFVARAVDESQHRDRIPLAGAKPWPELDILIPEPGADGLARGWVAFVHRSCCEAKQAPPQLEAVDVYLTRFDEGPEVLIRVLLQEPGQAGKPVAELLYPPSDWSYPAGSPKVMEAFTKFMQQWVAEGTDFKVSLIGLSAEDRLPLAAVRASLLGASLDSGLLTPVYTASPAKLEREAIIIVIQQKKNDEGDG
ncbi:MAG: hypothetical protein ABI563_06655 [Specibacter sp.]